MKLPALPLATYSQVRQGETVFAFGSPIGLRNSLTHGLVSAVARQVDPDSPLILRADRRADQSRQLRRPAGQHPRRSGRRQHVHRVAVGRQRRPGLRHSERDGQNGVPPAEAIRSAAPAGSRHEHADHHAGHGRRARPGERLRRHRLRRLARRPGRGGRPEGRRHPGLGRWPARRQPADASTTTSA